MNRKGFSVLEVVIALALSVLVFGGLFSLLRTGTAFFARSAERGDPREAAHLALSRAVLALCSLPEVRFELLCFHVHSRGYRFDHSRRSIDPRVDSRVASAERTGSNASLKPRCCGKTPLFANFLACLSAASREARRLAIVWSNVAALTARTWCSKHWR